MRNGSHVAVIIPALNEADAIAKVIAEIPPWVDQIMVADNGSKDATRERALQAGADVVLEKCLGYGAACLRALSAITPCDIIVFLDGDYSDYPGEMARLVDPIVRDETDFVVGSRKLGTAQPGSITPQQIFGNWLAVTLIRLIWRHRYTDLGPFRAIAAEKLALLAMADRDYGWTVEMQIKAIEKGLRIQEVPVNYRNRIGTSKVSGTFRGSLLAGYKILSVISRNALRRDRQA